MLAYNRTEHAFVNQVMAERVVSTAMFFISFLDGRMVNLTVIFF